MHILTAFLLKSYHGRTGIEEKVVEQILGNTKRSNETLAEAVFLVILKEAYFFMKVDHT